MEHEHVEQGSGASKPEPEIHQITPPKSFLQFLAEQGSGAVAMELSHKLRDLTEEIERHFESFKGKVEGAIKVKIKLVLDRGVYKVETSYDVDFPKAPPNPQIMWLGPDGNLATENPKQLRMPFTGLTGGKS